VDYKKLFMSWGVDKRGEPEMAGEVIVGHDNSVVFRAEPGHTVDEVVAGVWEDVTDARLKG
jgi:hypothetical protein